MNSRIILIAAAFALCAAHRSGAQENVPRVKSVPATRIESPPVIDGRLDDDVWQLAKAVEDMHEVSPNEYEDPSEPSGFLVLFDDDNLYIGARFLDSEPDRVVARVLRQGDVSQGDDGVTVILDPFNQGRSGYAFKLNPNGIRSEALFKNVTEQNTDWQGIWHGAAKKNGEGWSAELAIPFKTLSFDPANDTWGINFGRSIGRKNEDIGWVSYNRAQNPANSGKLTGMSGFQQGLGLDIVPSFSATESRDYQTPSSSTDFQPSLDVFYKPTPSMTAALTINTDFSGTSADVRQINLSRFSVFFPEKRNFFLQDTDIFEFGRIGGRGGGGSGGRAFQESGRPFFSRRIGLNSDGDAIDIIGGLKLTGRVGRWDYGVLDIQQSDYITTDLDAVDARNLFVGRIAASVLEESSLGVIATNGDPRSNLSNTLVGVDFRYLNTRLPRGRTLEGAIWAQKSRTEGLSGNDAAFGFSLESPNTQGWLGGVSYREFQDNFNPALGFVRQSNARDMAGEIAYIWRPSGGIFRSIKSGVDMRQTNIIGGRMDTRRISFQIIRLENNTDDDISTNMQLEGENLTEPFEIFEGVIIPPGDYSWRRHCIRGGTGQQRAFRINGYVCGGGFYDGDRVSWGPGMTWRPSEHFRFNLAYRVNDINLPYGSFTTEQVTINADIAFTATWYWENLIQYDNVSDSIGINSIMRWIPLAGREMVFVVNRDFVDFDETNNFVSSTSDLAFKANYTFRF